MEHVVGEAVGTTPQVRSCSIRLRTRCSLGSWMQDLRRMATQMEVFAGRFECVDVAMISFVHDADCYSSVKLVGFGGVSLKALRWALECACRITLMQPPG